MEIRFDPQFQSLPRIEKKRHSNHKEKAFEEALQGEAGQNDAQADESSTVRKRASEPTIAKTPRNDDGKGLKVDLLA